MDHEIFVTYIVMHKSDVMFLCTHFRLLEHGNLQLSLLVIVRELG